MTAAITGRVPEVDLCGTVLPREAARRLKLPPLTEGRFARIYTDRISKAVRHGIAAGFSLDPAPGFHWSVRLAEIGDKDSLRGAVGLPNECDRDLLTILEENPALVMQTELILSARVFQQCRFEVLRARLSVPSILDDRGIKRHKSGSHKLERLEEERRALRFLTSLKIDADYWSENTFTPEALKGAVWKVPEDDRAALWSSAIFTVGRGDPFFKRGWALDNDFAKPIGAGLLRLTRHKAAVLLGAFLATLGPMNAYFPKVIDTNILFAEARLAGSYTKNPKERREVLEEALDAVKAESVIGAWRYEDAERTQVRIEWPKGIKAVPHWRTKNRGRRA